MMGFWRIPVCVTTRMFYMSPIDDVSMSGAMGHVKSACHELLGLLNKICDVLGFVVGSPEFQFPWTGAQQCVPK